MEIKPFIETMSSKDFYFWAYCKNCNVRHLITFDDFYHNKSRCCVSFISVEIGSYNKYTTTIGA